MFIIPKSILFPCSYIDNWSELDQTFIRYTEVVSSSISWLGINVSRWYDNYILILSSLVAETLILFWERICSLSSDGSVLASRENPGLQFLSVTCPEEGAWVIVLAKETEVNSARTVALSPFLFCALSMAVMTTATAFILQAQCIQHKNEDHDKD